VVHRHGKRLSAAAEAFKRFVLAEARSLLAPNRPGERARSAPTTGKRRSPAKKTATRRSP